MSIKDLQKFYLDKENRNFFDKENRKWCFIKYLRGHREARHIHHGEKIGIKVAVGVKLSLWFLNSKLITKSLLFQFLKIA